MIDGDHVELARHAQADIHAAAHAHLAQAVRDAVGACVERGIGQLFAAERQRDRVRAFCLPAVR